MAVGFTTFTANAALNAIGNNTSFAVTTSYIKLHIGDPGAAGTTNAAGNTTRKSISFGTAATGAMSNDVALTWTSVSTSEDYTHFSIWDDLTVGNCLWTGTVTADPVSAGNNFTIAIGDLDLSMTVAA